MKNVIIIGSRTSGKKNNPDDIARSIASSETNVTQIYWEDVVFSIKTGDVRITAGDVDIIESNVDLVIAVGWYKNGKKSVYRDVAYALALTLKHWNITFWNSEMVNQRSTTKLSAMVQLALEAVPVPTSWFSLKFANMSAEAIQYPFVAKAVAASRGDSNYLIENDEQALDAVLTD